MRHTAQIGLSTVILLVVAACGVSEPLSGSRAPIQDHRLDLGAGVVAAFVEDASLEPPSRVAYVTHVVSGEQVVVNCEGRIVDRHPGRGGGADRMDEALSDGAAMERIMEGLCRDRGEGASTGRIDVVEISWVPSVRFGGITYVENWHANEPSTVEGERAPNLRDLLGPKLHRVAFTVADHAGSGYILQDGDATLLAPGTPVHAVEGYAHEFRLAALADGRVEMFEADVNPLAENGEDLIDIRAKVTSIDVLSQEDATTVLGTIDEALAVGSFVELVLGSPIDQERRGRDEGERCFLGFRLADGTSVVRAFWVESGQLWPGIMTDPAVASIVREQAPTC
ncbi:MAG: hypothetical protein F4X40_07180 [Chloroflexi bacterium]|nr:hypothetical protein [Chloroflexota bacterium]